MNKFHNILTWFALLFSFLITFSQSNAEQTQPFSNILKVDLFVDKIGPWSHHQMQSPETELKLAPSTVLAGAFCFVAASISSAGGIGGGGLYIPILTIMADLDLKTASSFSAFMVTGGSIANVVCNLFSRSAKFGGKTLIDHDIALPSEPGMLLGVSVGVICNLVFPEWLITILFAVFLAWSTFKTCKNGVCHWNLESEEAKRSRCGNLESPMDKNGTDTDGSGGVKSVNEPLLGMELPCDKLGFPWMKLGILILIWFCFSFVYLFVEIGIERGYLICVTIKNMCGALYQWNHVDWDSGLSHHSKSLLQRFSQHGYYSEKIATDIKLQAIRDIEDITGGAKPDKLIFPIMALLAGILGGVFGIGGGMLISPILLHVGIPPEITAATCSFMVFFSSTMSAFQYLLLGMENVNAALLFAIICFVASLLGLLVVQRAIKQYGRASLIVFSVSIVMALSTVLMTCFAALDVWRDYKSGRNMGFKLPC